MELSLTSMQLALCPDWSELLNADAVHSHVWRVSSTWAEVPQMNKYMNYKVHSSLLGMEALPPQERKCQRHAMMCLQGTSGK